ncbi:MAG TPA: DNA ligase D, partial [Candidatus Dormibacteraeota bacterium]
LATLVDAPFSDPGWVFELKYDGVRALLRCQGDQLTLQGRSGRDETERYPELEQARPFLQARECLIDGEIVALDQDGRPSFSALQQRIGLRPSQAAEAAEERPVTLMAFDLLFADGHDLRRLPLEERKRALRALIQENPLVRYADEIPEQGEEFYRQVSRLQLEGVIAKRARSTYASGKRTRDWLKIKVRPTQDCVICGYAPGKGRRSEIGALILGVFVEGELRPAGRVGTGFSDRQLAELRGALDRISRRTPPWSEREAADRDVIWASPKVVCEVEHAGWTVTGKLRQPSFRTLRPDVPPRACIRAPELSGEEVRVSYSGKSQPTETTSPGPPNGDREIDQALQELAELPAKGGPLRVGEHTVAVTHLDKLLWPEDGLTKRDLIGYHLRVSRYLLPHLRDRAIVTQVFPDGIGGKSFWRRAVPDTAPKWLARWQAHPGTPTICPLVQEPAALVWLANQGAIEIHPWHSRRDRPTQPDWAVFDLDPGPKAGWSGAVEVAHLVKAGLDHLKTEGWLKTTGQSGLHIYVPIRRGPVEEVVRDWVGQLGHQVAQVAPQLVTETWSVRARGGLVRIDYTQNVIGKTLASVYSPRPAPGAPVSTPIDWDELDGLDPKRFNLRTVADRVRDRGDLFAPVLGGRQRLPGLKGSGGGAEQSGGSTTRRK